MLLLKMTKLLFLVGPHLRRRHIIVAKIDLTGQTVLKVPPRKLRGLLRRPFWTSATTKSGKIVLVTKNLNLDHRPSFHRFGSHRLLSLDPSANRTGGAVGRRSRTLCSTYTKEGRPLFHRSVARRTTYLVSILGRQKQLFKFLSTGLASISINWHFGLPSMRSFNSRTPACL
jgi:hypothetical protein